MTKTALLLPGQVELPAENVLDIIRTVPQARRIVELLSEGKVVPEHYYIEYYALHTPEILNRTVVAHLTQFACSASLAEEALNQLKVDYLVGNSLGDVTAFYLAGAFSLETALRIIAFRAGLLDRIPNGAMAVVRASASTVKKILGSNSKVAIGVINGPKDCTLSGVLPELEQVLFKFAEEQIAFKLLDYPQVVSHSPLLRDLSWQLYDLLQKSSIGPLRQEIIGTNLVRPLKRNDRFEVETYLREQLTTTVRFYDTIRLLRKNGVSRVVECGARVYLGKIIEKSFPGEFEVVTISNTADLEKLR